MTSPPEVEGFISDLEHRVAPVERAVSEAWWALATTGSEESKAEFVRAGNAYDEVFADEESFQKVRSWHEERSSFENPLLRRQIEVLYRSFAAKQGDREVLERMQELEAEANSVYSNHRSVVRGREVGENEIREVLGDSTDERLRREVWEASKSVGREVEDTVRELASLRNRLARAAGYPDHYRRSLELQELDPEELSSLMNDLETTTDAPFRALKEELDQDIKQRHGVSAVMPWHHADPFFQEAPEGEDLDPDRYFASKDLEELTRKAYDAMDLDVRGVMVNSDLYERTGKDQHAFCLSVGREYPYDVRVLANLRPDRPDTYWMDTMLHEFGHAVYDRHINPKLPYFLRSVSHLCTTEAIALMMGSLASDPGWLSSVAGVPKEELEVDEGALAARRRAAGLVFTRWALVMFHFEQALYADPDRDDLNSLWWGLVERLQLVNRPPGRDEPDWAAKIHVAVAPVYYHNYVLGHLTAAQLRHYLETHITQGPFFMSEVAGRYLLEAVFGPGARDDWQTTVLRATGEPLNPEYFVKSLR
jgi:peptidyl-dipeptidase A